LPDETDNQRTESLARDGVIIREQHGYFSHVSTCFNFQTLLWIAQPSQPSGEARLRPAACSL